MKRHSYYCLATVVLFISLIAGCEKSEEFTPAAVRCRPVKQYTNNNQIPPDSARYSYMNNQISQIEFNSFYRNIEYSNTGKVSKVYYFQKGHTAALLTMAIFYEPDGKIKRIERTAKYLPLYKRILEFVYGNDKAEQVKLSEYDVNGVFIPNEEVHTFTYTGKNITSHKIEVSGGNPEVISLEYDNKTNYFTKQNPQFLVLDPFFSDSWMYNCKLLPYLLSANNVVRTSDAGVYGGAIKYSIDKNGNLSEFSIGSRLIGYLYVCG